MPVFFLVLLAAGAPKAVIPIPRPLVLGPELASHLVGADLGLGVLSRSRRGMRGMPALGEESPTPSDLPPPL